MRMRSGSAASLQGLHCLPCLFAHNGMQTRKARPLRYATSWHIFVLLTSEDIIRGYAPLFAFISKGAAPFYNATSGTAIANVSLVYICAFFVQHSHLRHTDLCTSPLFPSNSSFWSRTKHCPTHSDKMNVQCVERHHVKHCCALCPSRPWSQL